MQNYIYFILKEYQPHNVGRLKKNEGPIIKSEMSNDINAQIHTIESNIVETTQSWTKIMGIITLNAKQNRTERKEQKANIVDG